MINFLNFLIDVGKFLGMVLAVFVVVALFIVFASKTDEIMDKRECYEIYATDNVILKKCQKYFEVSK